MLQKTLGVSKQKRWSQQFTTAQFQLKPFFLTKKATGHQTGFSTGKTKPKPLSYERFNNKKLFQEKQQQQNNKIVQCCLQQVKTGCTSGSAPRSTGRLPQKSTNIVAIEKRNEAFIFQKIQQTKQSVVPKVSNQLQHLEVSRLRLSGSHPIVSLWIYEPAPTLHSSLSRQFSPGQAFLSHNVDCCLQQGEPQFLLLREHPNG